MSSLPIVCIIFSRDRAMQLDAALRSLIRHCKDFQQASCYLIYQASNPQHVRQYSFLANQYAQVENIQFITQRNIRFDLYRCVMPPSVGHPVSSTIGRLFALGWKTGVIPRLLEDERFLQFLVDDNLFVSDFSLADIVNSLSENPKALGFSLRLGLNTTYCYVADGSQKLSNYRYQKDQVIEYEWRYAEGDFGYPLEISSSIYRCKDLLKLFAVLNFDNPNTLESLLAGHSNSFSDLRPMLLCYEHSVAFCNPINKVQDVFDNRVGDSEDYSCQSLANLFDKGYRIDVGAYSSYVPSACHQEVSLHFTSHKSKNL